MKRRRVAEILLAGNQATVVCVTMIVNARGSRGKDPSDDAMLDREVQSREKNFSGCNTVGG